LNRKSPEEFKTAVKIPVVVVLDNVRSLNNIGSFFRTADAFLAEKLLLCGITACPPHNDIRKTALGAEETVVWEYFENTEDAILSLKSEEWIIVSAEQVRGSTLLDDFTPCTEAKYALVFGNEVKGVQQHIADMSDFCLEIPQDGTKHSLNVAVSAGVVLWEFYRFFRKTL
jgi:tRNA G18 (ribose-2'-O)-methylase SpoU